MIYGLTRDLGKLHDAFSKFVEELGLAEDKRKELLACSNEKKLALLVSKTVRIPSYMVREHFLILRSEAIAVCTA